MEFVDSPTILIHSEIAKKINFACHQSSFAFLRELRIQNSDVQTRLEDVLVTISADPAFLKPKSWRLDRISSDGSVSIKDRDVQLEGGFLLNLADSVRGTVKITVEHSGEIVADQAKPVELLAYNEWGGAGYMPELLASFSMPNDPAVDRVLREASLILRKAGKPDGIDGYKGGSRQRVWEIASAIYSAIANLGITYAVPPASFERDGQKIRLPSQIIDNRVATCLDSTMLFASAVEQAGLNPLIALPKGHAVVGVWLQPEELTTIVIDDAETLRKRIQLKELLLIETTFTTSHPALPFSKAVSAAAETINIEYDSTFNAAVDIRRARAHRISPLGLKQATETPVEGDSSIGHFEQQLEESPVLPDFDEGMETDSVPETPEGRLDRWQRKLLDLSARNPLLNHRSTKTSLQIICPDPGLLEDKLAEGSRLTIQAIPQSTTQQQDEEIHRQRTGESISEEYALDALNRSQILVNLSKEELARRAVEIYRKAQTALQEGGTNTLYLGIGFLLWKRSEKDDRRFRAPLILLPVTLERKSVRSGIKLVAHDDEPRFNTTLLEMLRKDYEVKIHGLDGQLPEDQSGIDVAGIWNTVRMAVKDVPGFEVIEDVVLGHFSFAKYLMWKDLVDRTDALRKNAVVKHIIDTPRDPYPSDISFVDRDSVDRSYKPSDLLTPLPADASQMAAIATADRGKDFIIIGPPGTGKSQTISNLIAHLLGSGKTVLFVSEKTAALEVVYRRLHDIGLGRYCLQLHSNKARKADVLAQLQTAWSLGERTAATEWKKEAERLRVLRDQLNLFVDRLHMPRRNGMTVHHAIGVKVRDEDKAARVTFNQWDTSDRHDPNQLEALRNAVEKLQIQVAAVGDVSDSPFHLVDKGDWSPQWEAQVVERAGRLSAVAASTDRACDGILKALDIRIPDRSMARLDAVAALSTVLQDSYRDQTAFALEPDGADRIDALEEAVSRLKRYATAQASLSCAYAPMAWRKLDGEDISRRWQEAANSWWLKRFFARRRVIKDMMAAGAQGKPDPDHDAAILTTLRNEGEAIDRLDSQLSSFKVWKKHDTSTDKVNALQVLGQRAREAVGRLADDAQSLANLRRSIRTLMYDGNDLLAPEAAIGRATTDYLSEQHALKEACEAFENIAGQSVRERFAETEKALPAIQMTANDIAARHAELHDWCSWRRRRTQALDLELDPLVEAVEGGYIPTAEIKDTFEAAYCTWWSGAVIGEDDVLRSFSSPEHNAAILKFREIDSQFQRLTSDYISAKLAGNLPAEDDVKRTSSWGLLRREIQKRSRHKPVRQLVEEIPDVLSTLAPCLMMSPLSVAQYLPPDQALFDVVIFDEASQITVWDAVGSLARGRQAIIAGDPKQMPPTNFFNRSDDDADGDIDIEGDLESILDEMVGASIPQLVLNLHYRSRRESLIAFSNSRYYDNTLVTFPAPVHPDHGVRLVRPNGFYARGKARHNEGEAKAIVAEILRRLKHEAPEVRRRSIGVVTFNTEQQSLIENLLDEARSKHPEIEWAFSSDTTIEPVFVKNLETVQGDERDVILFSITYGPDQAGHITMNFGPLNRSGGERRLNVAMTRARSEMLVFSTLSPDKIDLSRTQAQAVIDLKHFLEYAERGPSALGALVHGTLGDFESPFESAVARGLRDKGWNVHPQIGVSAFRIDLGIVHPDSPGAYLAGVECDGAMYHSSAYARERDKIRQSVLEGLGWTLFRVWSTDWWTNRVAAMDKLDDALRICLEADRANQKKMQQKQDMEDGSITNEPHDSLLGEKEQEFVVNVENQSQTADVQLNETGINGDSTTDHSHYYVMTAFDEVAHRPDPDAFYSPKYTSHLTSMIEHAIDTEGPLHEDVLVRRIAQHHGFLHAGDQIRNVVLTQAKQTRPIMKEAVGSFYFPLGMTKVNQIPARYLNRDEEMKSVDVICKEEIRAINKALSLNGNALELARRLGVSQLTQSARSRIENVLK
ncbi:MAG: DUF3320 domain-containing protein [Candidatus Thiodiazotropha lotti]|nr:DUF3320 domain-containing protein [Candidatus Thiodiazotropha lotti]MCW4218779.1 DUF3320 domain-containing protein [Candidatus Thiodiazotropha lotti]